MTTMTLNAVKAEYEVHERLQGYTENIERWEMLAMAYRLAAETVLNQPYGSGERHRFDLFRAADTDAPVVVFIHGGYWQHGDRKNYSFIARELNANGITVAIPSYTLCPAVSVMEIGDEMQRCLAVLWEHTRKRPTVVGHAAGGHLAAEMMARDWTGFPGVPDDLVRTAYAISGVFDLASVVGTSLNKALSLTAGTARAASPLFRPPSPKGRRLVAAVGSEESEELLNQSRRIATNWSAVGIDATCEVVTGANHFTIIDELITSGSSMLMQIVGLAREERAA